ncbi:MAG: SAM-dependent methyltransferase [Saprospiraceae bacterium]|nr:SAM-dependent methyltransferase [Saprospiraceae bacterium]
MVTNNDKYGILYLIPTPLNEEEGFDKLPLYVVERVHKLNYFVVERAKTARHFVKRCNHPSPISALFFTELNEHTPKPEIKELMKPLLDGHDVGLMSEAGCPAVADPGSELVALCHRHGIEIRPLIGPSSILLGLMASGMNGQQFTFHGYLPNKRPELAPALKKIEQRILSQRDTHIFIEAPYRNNMLFEMLLQTLHDDIKLCIAKDLSSDSEWIKTLPISGWKRYNHPDFHKVPIIFILGV